MEHASMTIVGVIRLAVTMVTQDHHAIYVKIYNLYFSGDSKQKGPYE